METLHKYISEGLFSNDEIGDQVDKEFEKSIINKFKETIKGYDWAVKDPYFENMDFKFDEKNNTLNINFLNKDLQFYYKHAILKSLGFKIKLNGNIWCLNYSTDTNQIDEEVFENLNVQNFNLGCYQSYDNIDINLNMYNRHGYNEFITLGGELHNIKNLNFNIMDKCEELTIGCVSDIDNIYFDNKSKKDNDTLVIYMVDKSLNEKKYYAMKNKFDYFCKFFKNINLNIAKNRNILNNERKGIIMSIFYSKKNGFKMNKNYA